MITRPSNQIIGGVIPAEWELNTIVNCYKEKGDSLERGNYRGLKLTDQILKIAERNDFLVQLGLHQGSILSPYGVIYHNIHLEKLGQDVQKNCFMLMTLH